MGILSWRLQESKGSLDEQFRRDARMVVEELGQATYDPTLLSMSEKNLLSQELQGMTMSCSRC